MTLTLLKSVAIASFRHSDGRFKQKYRFYIKLFTTQLRYTSECSRSLYLLSVFLLKGNNDLLNNKALFPLQRKTNPTKDINVFGQTSSHSYKSVNVFRQTASRSGKYVNVSGQTSSRLGEYVNVLGQTGFSLCQYVNGFFYPTNQFHPPETKISITQINETLHL